MSFRAFMGVVLAPLLAVACGVPTDAQPRAIDDERVPFDLLDPAPGAGIAARPAAGSQAVTVFMVAGDRLVAVARQVAPPASPDTVLQALVAGVQQEEAAGNVRSAIEPTTRISAIADGAGTVRVELTPAFRATATDEQVLAVAQIVYTLTALPGVNLVTFTLAGRPVEVPTGDGTLRTGPVQREDFASVADL